MAGPWEAYQQQAPAQAPAAAPGPWQRYSAPEFTSTLNPNVVDDPARAAPITTQMGASLRTRPEEQIDIYSRSMGIPRERFGTLDGQIVYRDDQDRLVRVSPSVTGATGPLDAARRLGNFAARNAGEALPAAASMLATTGAIVPPASFATIPVAGLLGAAGEWGRQEIGDAVYGPRAQGTDTSNIAMQGGMAALGQGIGVGIGRAVETNPVGVVGSADRNFFRNPANVAEARRVAQAGEREGVTLFGGDVTNRNSLLQRDRQLGRFPDTTDDMGAAVRRRNAVEVPTAAGRNINAAAGAVPSIEGGRAQFQQGARQVIETAFERMQGLNSPLFQQAWEARPGPVWSEQLDQLLSRPAVVKAWQEAQTAAANSGRELPPLFRVSQNGNRLELTDASTFPDMQAWHMMKRSLDQIVNGGSDPLTGALRMPGGRDVREARDALRSALVEANPAYGRALAESAPRLQAFADLEATGIARTAERGGAGASDEGLAAIFDGKRMAPQRIAEYRQTFIDTGQGEAWNAGLSAYLRNALNDATQTVQRGGEPSNVAGKFYQNLFGTPERRAALAEAMGGARSPQFQTFAAFMDDVIQPASRSFPEGAPTATDSGARRGFASGGAQTAASVARAINPLNWPNAIGDFIENLSAGRNAQRIASGYAAGPANNAAILGEPRLLAPTTMGLLGAGGQVGMMGLLGLARGPQDELPPARRPY